MKPRKFVIKKEQTKLQWKGIHYRLNYKNSAFRYKEKGVSNC